jgi:hypothetical protein
MALSNFIPQLWSASVLEGFRRAEVVAPLVTREYEGLARSGNQVHIASLAIDDTDAIVQTYNGSHAVDDIEDSKQTILINQKKAVAFKVDDVDRVQAAGSMEALTRDAAKLLTEDAEDYIVSTMLTGGTNANAGGTGTVTDADEAFATVVALRTALSKANVPGADRYLVVNPDFAAMLLAGDSKLTSADSAGSDGELRNGVLGRILGFTVVESTAPGLANTAKPAAVALHSSAVAYVNQIEEVEAFRSPTAFADVIRMLHVYGAKVLRQAAVQYYLSA